MLQFRLSWHRWFAGFLALTILAAAYLFQKIDVAAFMGIDSPNAKFIVNKLTRFLLNDGACLLLITAIFNKPKYLLVSTWLFLAELLIFLPLYFILKLSLEGNSEISSPLLSQLHRMIVNPLLMIVLMMGFFYQDFFWKKTNP